MPPDRCLGVVSISGDPSLTLPSDKPNKQLTLVLLTRQAADGSGREVLLGQKKRGFGAGRWNGFGGKVEGRETITEGAQRELQEEACIEALDLVQKGVLTFDITSLPELLEVHVFAASEYRGVPTETEEMRPRWFPEDAIPFREMWADDALWFPLLLQGHCFVGWFVFRDTDAMLAHHLQRVPPEHLALCLRRSPLQS
eukprot:GGOE01042439.1.p1 GENE.GGOE01042439.1~~GGOE01042439.1.p1  ORF type:complete len:210 (+),score=66.56 GGOE01042439.1:38-631(+)